MSLDPDIALRSLSDSLVRLVETVSPAVVAVERPSGSGSGVVIAPDGYVLTNHHVVGRSERAKIRFHNGEEVDGAVLGRDQKTDLAVVRLDPTGPIPLNHLKLIDKRRVRVGQIVLAVGNPLRFERSVSWGLVSAIDRTLPSRNGPLEGLIQTDAAINPGNSGGPLVSTDAEIVGINTAVVPYAQGLGFAIPAYTASWVVGELIHKGRVRRRVLGIAASGTARGVLVHKVETGTPAHAGGIREGDILTRAEQQELWNIDDLQRVLSLGETRTIEFEIIRSKKRITKSVVPTLNAA